MTESVTASLIQERIGHKGPLIVCRLCGVHPVAMDHGGITWEAPGPGVWAHDPAHFPAPLTGFSVRTGMPGSSEGFALGFARYGHATLETKRAVVNGWAYGQRVPIDGALFAEREQAARNALEQRLWRIDGERWFQVERPKILGDCRSTQSIDPSALNDGALAQHLLDTLDLQRQAHVHHFSHVPMVFVVGEWLLAAERWGITPRSAHQLLAGASPATAAAARDLELIATALREAGITDVTSLDDVRAVSSEAAAALDEYLDTYGWRTVGGFDFDAVALIEMPELIVTSIQSALASPFVPVEPDVAAVRDRVPEDERDEFDDRLTEARYVYGIRDDDVVARMWTRGLIRRALLEIAARLLDRGGLEHRDHVLEAGADELIGLLQGADGPRAAELAARASLRRERSELSPPATIGVPPPATGEELPPAVRRVSLALAAYLGRPPATDADGDAVVGAGAGDRTHIGRACVAARVEDAAMRLEPGDVLVTAMTTPAFNAVLSIAGALVVEHGGMTSHSGIMARELGLPAVLDARGCMTRIPDGATVEVDPTSGTVRIV